MAKSPPPPPPPPADVTIDDQLPPPKGAANTPAAAPPAAATATPPAPGTVALAGLAGQVAGWAQQEAQTIASQGLTGIQVSPDTVARTQDLLQKLAMNGIQALGADAATKATLAQARDLYLSALKDLGVVGTKSIEDVVGQSARKFFVDAADFLLQGLTKVGI